MHSVITERGGDTFFSGVTMGAAEEELGAESEMAKRGEAAAAEGEIAECDLSSVLENPALRSQRLV